MELYLVRHADAVDGHGSDFARTLSDKGRKQAERIGEWLKAMKVELPLIVTSPYPRAHETADIVGGILGCEPVRQDERLASGMPVDAGSALIHEYGRAESRLMLVGHAPDLGLLASHLIGAKDEGVEMRKGAVARLETLRPGFGGSTLEWLVSPKLLL